MTLLTPRNAAKETGFPLWLLRKAIRDGHLIVVHIEGRKFPLIDLADLERFVKERKSGTIDGATEVSALSQPIERLARLQLCQVSPDGTPPPYPKDWIQRVRAKNANR